MMIGQRPARGFDPYMPQPVLQDAPPPPIPQALMQAASAPPAPAKPKINWLGVLADALSGAAGQPGQYAASMREQRREQSALERGEEQYQRRRMDNREDKIWERDNTPRSPYRWESNDGSLMEMGPNGLVRQVYKDPTPKMIQVPGVDADGNPVMRLVPMPSAQANPTGPVGGWADEGEGGQSPPATGNFPSGSPLDPNLGQPPRPYYR